LPAKFYPLDFAAGLYAGIRPSSNISDSAEYGPRLSSYTWNFSDIITRCAAAALFIERAVHDLSGRALREIFREEQSMSSILALPNLAFFDLNYTHYTKFLLATGRMSRADEGFRAIQHTYSFP
jgi:hypothetical protein